jgi:hypothetical protein
MRRRRGLAPDHSGIKPHPPGKGPKPINYDAATAGPLLLQAAAKRSRAQEDQHTTAAIPTTPAP